MKRLIPLTLIALLAVTAAQANTETPDPETPTVPDKPLKEKVEPGKGSAATSASICDRPTSVIPTGYPADAETWPCKNFSK